MKKFDWNIAWGAVLVLVGLLFLLQSFGLLAGGLSLLWTLLFAAGGATFLYVFITQSEQWWAVIPGFTLLGLALLIMLGSFGSPFVETLGAAIFMGSISAAFWVIYVRKQEYWWAVIPGGVLLTLAGIIVLSELLPGGVVGGLFFLGLALTFGLVYILPNPEGRMVWALIPAGVLGLMGILIVVASSQLLRWLWPLALIGVGGYLVLRTLMQRSNQP